MTKFSGIGEQQYKAFVERISHSMVFTLHHLPGCSPSIGTGVLIRFGAYTYIASALHNFTVQGEGSPEIIRTWNETRFKFKDEGTLKFRDHLKLPEESSPLVPGVRLSANRPPLIDRKLDLLAARLEPGEVVTDDIWPVDLKECVFTGQIKAGASLITVGMPYAGGIRLSGGGTVFHPHTDHVQHDPDIDTSHMPSSFSPDDHLLYHYSNHLDGIDPGGYSGAPVWSSYDVEEKAIWSARPAIVGMALRYYRTKKLLQAVRINHLITLLRADTLETAIPRPATA